MLNSTTETGNDQIVLDADANTKSGHGFFRRKSKNKNPVTDGKCTGKNTEKDETNSQVPTEDLDVTVVGDDNHAMLSAKPDVSPVSFISMFRFSTKLELFFDLIGLICAVAAGASQPLMSLIFGNITQDFVSFGYILRQSQGGNSTANALLPEAAASFRRAAALDAFYLVVIGIGLFIVTFLSMYIWIYTGEVNAKRVRERYLQAVLRQDIAFFDKVGAGEVATRIQTDTHLFQQGISEKVALVATFLGAFFTGFVLAYARLWRLALALTSILPCIGIAGAIMNKFMVRYGRLSLKHVAEGGTVAEEVISTVRTAQAFGTQKTLTNIYDGHIEESHKADLLSAIGSGCGISVFFFVIYASYALSFSFGTTLINQGHADAGQVVSVFMAILIGSFSLALLAPEMQAVTSGLAAAAKLFQTIDLVPDIDSADPGGLRPEKIDGEVTLENVTFNYPSRPNVPVMRDLSITFPAGKTAALVGASGCGKSTIVSLVERFYDPLSGAVKIDGINVRDLNVKWLRSQIGLVSQEPVLFATTIKGNVAHGLIGTKFENASDEEKFHLVKEACVKANADAFICGQKQRVAIARAIVSDPRILLLDEATSALDTRSEGVVQDALDKASAGRTTLIITHRLSTIKDADQIFVMGEGLVLEQGTHNDLLSDENGAYSRLVQAQKLRERCEATVFDFDGSSPRDENEDIEKVVQEEIPLNRKETVQSIISDISEKRPKAHRDVEKDCADPDYTLLYLFKRMGTINREGWGTYAAGSMFSLMTGATHPAFSIVYAMGIDGFSNPDPHQRRLQGDRNALWLFIIALISTLATAMQNYLFTIAAANLTSKLRSLSFKAILRQDIEFFDKEENTTGSLTSRLSENPQKINGLAGLTLGTIVQSIACLVAGTAIGLAFIWKVALVGVACTPFLVWTGYIRLRVVVMKDQENKKAHESSAHLACEAAGSIRTVASLTREDDCCAQYSKGLEIPLKNSNRTAIWSHLLFSFSQAVVFFVIALVFWYGSRLVSTQEFTIYQFFIGVMATTFGAIQAGNVFAFVPDISSAKSAGSDIIKLLDSVPEIDAESTDGKTLDANKVLGQIRFENVHFRYPTRPGVRVLRDLSFQVEPGTYIALVGSSGSGKSTAIQLIERFYDPLAGSIYLDDLPISELNVQEYRKQIALVSQEPTLYAGTIRFNVLLGATKPESEVTQDEIEAACRDANILDFIQSLPEGFGTEVGGKGSQLSGGQKQRIAIARALLRNPKVLLLDEATSALDSTSEKAVQEALDQAAKGRTTIGIAHRLSTIQNADCIYFIKDGKVSESGTHDQLLARRGDYYEHVQLQTLSKR